MKQSVKKVAVSIVLAITVACGGSSGSSSGGSGDTATSNLFPAGVTIASPLNTSSASASVSTALHRRAATVLGGSFQSDIDALLTATDIADCAVDLASLFSNTAGSVSCYGPQIDYANHADEVQESEETGDFPPGDLGIWTETESDTGEACAAAQLNAQMTTMEGKTAMAMTALASMVCVANNSSGLPADGASVDLSADMSSAIDSSAIAVSSASLALESAEGIDTYQYALNLSLTVASETYDINFDMTHRNLDVDTGSYDGRLTYQFNDTMSGGGCPSDDVTRAGSILYAKDSDGAISARSDEATFCQADDTPFTSDSVLDPSYKNDGTNPGGWGISYSVLIANYDPETSAGAYSYAWQAGPNDGTSRTFNITVDVNSDGELEAESYYGYGKDVEDADFDGTIDGFICNWAGPGSTQELSEYVQHQTLHEDGGVFVSDSADIGYAPTNDCTYDVADDTDGYIFSYDLDGDGSISSGEEDTIADGIANDLLDINSMSFTAPEAPENF